jgi:hypothetical protein
MRHHQRIASAVGTNEVCIRPTLVMRRTAMSASRTRCLAHPSRTRALLIWGAMARWTATADHPWGLSREDYDRLIQDCEENGISGGRAQALVQMPTRRSSSMPSAIAVPPLIQRQPPLMSE